MKEIKENGKGEVENTPDIADEDLTKLYSSVYFKTNTQSRRTHQKSQGEGPAEAAGCDAGFWG